MTGRRLRQRALLCWAAALLTAGCGVSVQPHPHSLASSPSPRGTSLVGPVTRLTVIYLVRSDRVMPSHRAVPDPVTLQRTIEALLNGPTSADASHGLRSAIPSSLRLRRVEQTGDTAIVDVTHGLGSVSTREQELAIAQLVYTVTGRPGIHAVRILVDGDQVQVARADGTLTNGDVTRSDYSSLVA